MNSIMNSYDISQGAGSLWNTRRGQFETQIAPWKGVTSEHTERVTHLFQLVMESETSTGVGGVISWEAGGGHC